MGSFRRQLALVVPLALAAGILTFFNPRLGLYVLAGIAARVVVRVKLDVPATRAAAADLTVGREVTETEAQTLVQRYLARRSWSAPRFIRRPCTHGTAFRRANCAAGRSTSRSRSASEPRYRAV